MSDETWDDGIERAAEKQRTSQREACERRGYYVCAEEIESFLKKFEHDIGRPIGEPPRKAR